MINKSPVRLLGAAILAASLFATSACSDPASGDSGGGSSEKVSLVGFSILKTANKDLVADFKESDAGKDVEFSESYGAPGDQARAVIAGLKADQVHFSLAHIDPLDDLPVELEHKAQHPVRRRMLRSEIDGEVADGLFGHGQVREWRMANGEWRVTR